MPSKLNIFLDVFSDTTYLGSAQLNPLIADNNSEYKILFLVFKLHKSLTSRFNCFLHVLLFIRYDLLLCVNIMFEYTQLP